MNQLIKKLFFSLLGICICTMVSAQAILVKNSKSKSRIFLVEGTSTNKTAAEILQMYIQKMTNCNLPIIIGQQKMTKGDIVIGGETPAGVTEDGFSLSTKDGILRISGSGNGTVYGVVTLLEQYLGVDYWGENEYSFNPAKTIELPLIDKIDNPAFRYRQTQCYAIRTDSIYKWWNRLEEPNEVFAAGYWVHTFDKLLPASVYGKDHPEYYSY